MVTTNSSTYLFLWASIRGLHFSINMSDCWTAAALLTTDLNPRKTHVIS